MTRDVKIGENVKALRVAAGLSQAQLAERMTAAGLEGIYPQTITRIEQGKRSLKLHEGIALARILHVAVDSLLERPSFADQLGASLLLGLEQAWRELVEKLSALERARTGVDSWMRNEHVSDETRSRMALELKERTLEEAQSEASLRLQASSAPEGGVRGVDREEA